MTNLTDDMLQLAFDLNGEPLTKTQITICEEWNSGWAEGNMKIDLDDPKLLEYAGYYIRLKSSLDSRWENIIIGNQTK